MKQYIILSGGPIDGYDFYGPFNTQEEAVQYAVNNLDHRSDWVLAELIAPKGE